ncbi:nucleotidyltransferase substrate binding protein [Mucilaginibacter sp. BJC16-A38]|uniref:nucleotidyltransferase substrate binding protein n=1 Tax=Mucilaginibacter phenanthrenivorans TaxID=1234842 RepID=UPI002157899C|nr:nucleotidyltransferase substrate binding protein [Mucilaginibacter phenanthrenivorans]MCR8560920.1 nucleotidyltransferase substrate binding protein [Mucilaginibacter phenanthrenivorans]
MENKDIRWIQRFNNFRKALKRLAFAVELSIERPLSDLEEQGMIQAFEFTYDLAWKTLQDILRELKRPNDNGGPTIILDQAFADGFITDREGWKELKKSRELSSHTYDEETADEIAANIVAQYYGLFVQLETRLQIEKINQEKNG